MRSPHPKQVPGPAWGSIREQGAKWAALAISSPPAGLSGYILVGSQTRHRLPAPSPKPASQGCSLDHLFQGPSQRWSSHEAPRGQDVPRSDGEAEFLPCPPPGQEQGLLACFSHQETLVPTESSACRPSGADTCLQDPSGSTHHTCSPALGPSCYLLINHPVLTSNQKLTP